jgi:hypothetical protein
MFDFLKVKEVVSQFGDKVRTTKSDLEKLKQERDLIATAPTSKADAIRALHARLDSRGRKISPHLRGSLTPLIRQGGRGPRGHAGPGRVQVRPGDHVRKL